MPDEVSAAAPRSAPSHQIVLAFDFGKRRIGVACGGAVSRTASPLGAVPVGSSGPRWETLDSMIRDWQPTMLVVGLPYNVDGSESASAGGARGFASDLAKRYTLPVELIDERYSSLEAEARLKGARASGRRKRRVAKGDVDAQAACVILERWLENV